MVKYFFGDFYDFVVIYIIGCRQDYLFGVVMFCYKCFEIIVCKCVYLFLRFKDCVIYWLIRIGVFLQLVKDYIIGCIQCLIDFLQDYVMFDFDFIWIKYRVQKDVVNDINCQWYIVFQNMCVVGCDFVVGVSVDIIVYVFNCFGNLQCVVFFCVFECYMFKEMCDVILCDVFMMFVCCYLDVDGG